MKKDDILDFLDAKFAKVSKKKDKDKKKKRKKVAEPASVAKPVKATATAEVVDSGLVASLANEQAESAKVGVPITSTSLYTELVPTPSSLTTENAGVKALK